MGKSIGILIILLGICVLASIVYSFPVDPNLAKTLIGILLIMLGIIEVKERALA